MDTVNAETADTIENPHNVKVSKLYDTEHAQVMHIALQPGEALKRHVTPVDVFFYVLEGKGAVEVGEEQREVGPDTLIDSPAKIPHCWYNKGDEVLRVLVAKVPRQTESSKLL
jgi:mannose-6-phosphate isomerase-like protein (cupin superfamily)